MFKVEIKRKQLIWYSHVPLIEVMIISIITATRLFGKGYLENGCLENNLSQLCRKPQTQVLFAQLLFCLQAENGMNITMAG